MNTSGAGPETMAAGDLCMFVKVRLVFSRLMNNLNTVVRRGKTVKMFMYSYRRSGRWSVVYGVRRMPSSAHVNLCLNHNWEL